MATRFYFSSTAPTPLAVAADAAWEAATPAIAGAVSTSKDASATTNFAAGLPGGAGEDGIVGQFASPPLAAQEISGTVKGQFLCLEEADGLGLYAQCVIRVVSANGSVVRGTLLAAHAEALSSEWSGLGARNRKTPLAAISPANLTPVTAQEGDRLVIEVGFRQDIEVTGADGFIRFGAAGSDLAENETSSSGDPWMEFSGDIAFGAEAAPASTPPGGIGIRASF